MTYLQMKPRTNVHNFIGSYAHFWFSLVCSKIEKIIKNGPTDEDLDKVKKAKLLSRKDQLEQNRFWLSVMRSADYNKTDLNNVLNYEENINALTKKDLQEVAKKYLTKGYLKAVLLPED